MKRIKYYYGREPETNHPKVAVCVIEGDEPDTFFRGVAICSDSEKTISKQKARNMAFGRAFRAYLKEEFSMPVIRDEAKSVLKRCGCFFNMKSDKDLLLTEYERRLFEVQ